LLDRTTFSTWSAATALHWKCTSVNAFIPQWNFKRMHSTLKWCNNFVMVITKQVCFRKSQKVCFRISPKNYVSEYLNYPFIYIICFYLFLQIFHLSYFSLWILFVLDYLLLEITTPLIVYIWRRHGGTWKFGFEFHWDVKHLFYNHVTTS
jgi:hypothetical protein